MAVPAGFINLATAYNRPDMSLVDIIGVVTDIMPVKLVARTGQFMVTFSLLDPPFHASFPGLQGLAVRFFKEDATQLPKLGGIGDVVLLRSVKMLTRQGQKSALSNHGTVTLVFPSAAIPSPGFRIAANDTNKINCSGTPAAITRLSLLEQGYVIDIKSAMSDTMGAMVQTQGMKRGLDPDSNQAPALKKSKSSTKHSPAVQAYGNKFRLISELTDTLFADIAGQVVKHFTTPQGSSDLYITDYTENKQMYHYPTPEEKAESVRDGDTFGYTDPPKYNWPGPYGYLVLKVNVMPPHSGYVNDKIQTGDFVLLRNVRAKIQKAGLQLEGNIWPDTRYPDKIGVQKLPKDEHFAIPDLCRRKNQYWSARTRLTQGNVTGKTEPKPPDAESKDMAVKSKGKNRKRKRQSNVPPVDSRSVECEPTVSRTIGPSDINPHVRCSHDDIRVISVKDILDPDNQRHSGTSASGQAFVAPFVNANYRTRVRVVDYEPKALEDFSAPSTQLDDDDSDSMAWVGEGSQPYEWYFRLLLEDCNSAKMRVPAEHNRLWVNVGHEQAQFLFGNSMDNPGDLRIDSRQLAQLREKLFVLWGNLEENAGQELSNRLFECCIMEYGIQTDSSDTSMQIHAEGWSRTYSMFGTTIM